MAYMTVSELRKAHYAIRKNVNILSRSTHKFRHQVKGIHKQIAELYESVRMSRTQKKMAIAKEVRMQVKALANPMKDEFTAPLRAIEGERLKIESARETLTNPIIRLNASTLLDKGMAASRANAAIILQSAGPAELAMAAEAAKSVGDLGTLAACVTRNSNYKTTDRRMTNAELLSEIDLPDQNEIQAIYQETVSLPAYASQCLRSLDNMGEDSGAAKIERGLADRQVELYEDGSLKNFTFGNRPTSADISPTPNSEDTPKPKDIKPENFESAGEYLAHGGDTAFVAEHGDKFWEDLKAS